MYDFAKEMYFDIRYPGFKTTRDRALRKLANSPAITASNTSKLFLSENPNELCYRKTTITRKTSW